MNAGQGTLGKFATDTSFYVEARQTMESMQRLIDELAKNPGKISYGTSGIGSAYHLAGELIRLLTGVDMVHVPYKAGGQNLTDLTAAWAREARVCRARGPGDLPGERCSPGKAPPPNKRPGRRW